MFAKQLRETLSTVNKSELARALGCHRDTVAKWLAGDRAPSVVLLLEMCQYLYPDEWEKAFLHFAVLIQADK
jgi:transcriptional regulator with XRE-family HTH domain